MTEVKGVPFVDLVTPHVELEEELVGVARAVLRSGAFAGGPIVEEFEREFAKFCGAKHCIAVSNGTDALRFALMAAGIQSGDGVITVSNTFVATVEAIVQVGATPHFVDIDPRTFNMSVEALRQFLEVDCDRCERTGLPLHRASRRRISAILPVHLYGQMADMEPIMVLARQYGLIVIEDSCQAHGAEYQFGKEGSWRRAGSIGNAAAFSFYPTKNLGACGEAGAVTTNDENLAKKIRIIREHGQGQKYHHLVEGYNGRMDAMQAGFLKIKLRSMDQWNKQRRAAAETYNRLLAGADNVITPYEPSWSRAVYHLYVVRATDRDDLQRYLAELKIGTALHYPIPLHLQPAYVHFGYRKGDFPVTERLTSEILSLPMFPHIAPSQLEYVAEKILIPTGEGGPMGRMRSTKVL
jgi:dTDP-4-amino-4,6-dideoxygalactose transaminase